MKKLIAVIGLVLVLSLTACGDETLDLDDNEYVDTEATENVYTEEEVDQELNTIFETIDDDGVDFDSFDYEEGTYTELSSSSDLLYITEAGDYILEGFYSTTLVIDTEGDVNLVLNNVTMSSSNGPCIVVLNAEDVTISVPEGTSSTLTDASEYSLVLGDEDLDAVIYSTDDLEFNGLGTLNLNANYDSAIHTKDNVKISELTLNITSVDDGVVGKDFIAVKDATINVDSEGDALKATNTEDLNKGFIYIESGTFTLDTNNDGIEAVNSLIIYDGTFTIDVAGNGLETDTNMYLGGGTFVIDALEDTLNATTELVIYDGMFTLNAGDDAVHSDDVLTINGGTVYIESCYEGLEAFEININGGEVIVNSTDDAINATTGGGQEHGTMYTSTGGFLNITGGVIQVNATTGDGIDVNGEATMSGGYVLVYGTSADNQSALDFDVSFNISGGTIITLGSTGMIHSLSTTSTQPSVLYADSTSYDAGDLVTLYDSDGNIIFQVEAIRSFTGMVISVDEFELDSSYTLELDSDEYTFELTTIVTSLGDGGSTMTMDPGMGGRPGR